MRHPPQQIIDCSAAPGPIIRRVTRPPAPAPVSLTRIRVRYAEVDRMGYLWHGHYLAYFEEARTDWLRARGTTYRALEDAGTLLVIVETGLRHHRPARYDDEVLVSTRLAEARGPRLRFEYEVRRGDELLASGFTVLASADRTGRPCRPPGELAALAAAAGDGAAASGETGTAAGARGVQAGPSGGAA